MRSSEQYNRYGSECPTIYSEFEMPLHGYSYRTHTT